MAAADYNQVAQQLYVAYFGRPADRDGLRDMTALLDSVGAPTDIAALDEASKTNATVKSILENFGNSTESKNLYGSDSAGNAKFIAAIYQNVLGHSPDLAGLDFWVDALKAGSITRANAAVQIMAAAVKVDAVPADMATANNKVAVATNFTAAIDSAEEVIGYSGDAAAAAARALLVNVTSATDPVAFQATVEQTLHQIAFPPVPAVTLSLTAAADTGVAFTGGAGDDTFVGTLSSSASTLTAGDVLTGGAGNDTLSIAVSTASATAISGVTLNSVETVAVSNFGTANTSISLSQATGTTGVAVTASGDSTVTTTFTNVGNLVTAEMGSGAGNLTVTYAAAAVAGTADAQTLTLKGQTGGTFSVNGVETLNIVSSSSANTVALTDATGTSIKTINISGDQAVTLTEGGTAAGSVTVINASTATGAVKVSTTAAQDLAITGGSGNDVITFTNDNFNSSDTINGGAGVDTLSLAGASYDSAAFGKVTNVETVALTAAADITLTSNISATTIDLSDADAQNLILGAGYTAATTAKISTGDTVTNLVANVALTVEGTDTAFAGSTVSGGTGADTIKIKATSLTASAVNFATGGHVVGVETVTIVDGGDTSATKGRDISLTLGNYGTALTINAADLDGGTLTGDDETLTVDGTSFTKVLNVTGGAGRDTITGGSANDIINTGAGDDSINGSNGGSDSINAGAGDDTINMGDKLTSGDTIDGGAGNDILLVSGITASALTNVTNVETLALSGGGSATLTANLSFTQVDLSSGATAETLTLSTGYTNATTVNVDAGDKVVNDANVALTVKANASELTGTTITGGSGTDSLTLTIDAAAPSVAFDSLITGVESITIVDGGDATATAGRDITLNLGTYGTAVSIDGSALDAADELADDDSDEVLTVNGGSATKAITITTGAGGSVLTTGAGNDVLIGGSGVDSITSGAGNDSLNGGAGNDVFVLGANLTYQDTIIGGSGADTLSLTTAAAVADVDFMNVSGVETLNITTVGSTLTLANYASASGITTVTDSSTGGNIKLSATGFQNALTVNLNDGNDSVTGGLGNDVFVFHSSNLDENDSINGTSGYDTISIRNGGASGTAGVAGTSKIGDIANIDAIVVNDTASTGTGTVVINFDATYGATVANGQQDLTLLVDGSSLDAAETLTVNASANASTEKVSIIGGAANDTLTGGAANDIIVGGAGADSITGGVGADTLTGGDGADTFNYALASSQSTNALSDTITDFVSGTDAIVISYTTSTTANTTDFTNKGSATSSAEGLYLLSGTSNATRIGQYFYNSGTKQLVLDADGNGLIQAGDMFVTLTGSTTLADVNFNITAGGTQVSTITTGGGNDTITASTAADIISAGAGNDKIDISAVGTHSVNAGAGTDTIVGTNASVTAADSIDGGSGTDTLSLTGNGGTVALTTNGNLVGVENITFTGDNNSLDLTGQTEAFNVTFGNGDNSVTLNTGALAHTVTGGTAVDTVSLSSAADLLAVATLVGGSGDDKLVINTATTTLVDADFAKVNSFKSVTLTGVSSVVLGATATAAGIDTVITGAGNTSITSTQTANTVTATAVSAATLTLLGSANYTVTTGTDTTVVATGHTGTLAVTLGNDGNDATSLTTGNGNTTVTGVDANDVVTVTGLLTAGQTFTGSGAKFNVTATAGAQTITTGANNDTITGGAGADTLDGAAGDDTFVYASLADFVTGNAVVDSITGGAGTADKIQIAGAITLVTGDSLARVATVEQLVAATQSSAAQVHSIVQGTDANLSSIRTIDLSGDTHASSTGVIDLTGITSAITATTLKGVGAGANTITGGAGVDTIIGGSGNDVITGGAGVDSLTGGNGVDIFKFAAGDSGSTVGTVDFISDLAVGDKIDLSSIVASANLELIVSGTATALAGTGIADTTTADLDAFFAVVSGRTYLVYETTAGDATTQGTVNVIDVGVSLVGTLANFTETGGVITIVA